MPDWRRICEQDRRLAVDVGARRRVRHAVFDARDVAQQDRVPLALARRRCRRTPATDCDAAARAQRHRRASPASTRPPGISAFCACSARETSVTVRLCACSAPGSSETLIWRCAAADDDDLADAADALELAAQRLVGVLGDVANRLVGRHRERHAPARSRDRTSRPSAARWCAAAAAGRGSRGRALPAPRRRRPSRAGTR